VINSKNKSPRLSGNLQINYLKSNKKTKNNTNNT